MGRSSGPNGPAPGSASSRCWSSSGSLMPTSEPNRPMNMLPFTNAPRLPNIGLISTCGASGTRPVNRSRSDSVGFGIFISMPPRSYPADAPVSRMIGARSCIGHAAPTSASRQAILGAAGDLHGHARPVLPGQLRVPPPLLLVGQQIVRVRLQEQLHEHRVHGVLLGSAGGPLLPGRWMPSQDEAVLLSGALNTGRKYGLQAETPERPGIHRSGSPPLSAGLIGYCRPSASPGD